MDDENKIYCDECKQWLDEGNFDYIDGENPRVGVCCKCCEGCYNKKPIERRN